MLRHLTKKLRKLLSICDFVLFSFFLSNLGISHLNQLVPSMSSYTLKTRTEKFLSSLSPLPLPFLSLSLFPPFLVSFFKTSLSFFGSLDFSPFTFLSSQLHSLALSPPRDILALHRSLFRVLLPFRSSFLPTFSFYPFFPDGSYPSLLFSPF